MVFPHVRRGGAHRGGARRPGRLALAVCAALLTLLTAAGAGPVSAQVAPGPSGDERPSPGPMVGERLLPDGGTDPSPNTPNPRLGASGALTPFKTVSVPGPAVTDVVFDEDADIVVAGGSTLYRFQAPGLYVGQADTGAAISSISVAGGSVFAVRQGGGTERRDRRSLALQGTYPTMAGVTDQAVTGSWVLYTDAGGAFGRLTLPGGTTELFTPPSGTAVAIYALAGTNVAIGVTANPARVVQFDLATSPPTVVGGLDLLAGVDPVDVLGLGAQAGTALIRVGPSTLRRVGLPISGFAGTDLNGSYSAALSTAVAAGNGGWELFGSRGAPGSLTLFEGSATNGWTGTIDAGLTAVAWNAQGTQFAAVSPPAAGATTSTLRLYTPPGEPRPATAFAGADGEYHGITPTRVLDTREGPTGPAPLGPGGTTEVQVTGVGPVPAANVLAVAVNLTVISPTEPTYLTAYPSGEAVPFASAVNAPARTTRPNLAVVRVGAGGRVAVFNAAGTAHVVADVQGYFAASAGPPGGRYHPLTPSRLLDTRDGSALGADALIGLPVRGRSGVPAGAVAVALTVTAVAPSSDTFITAFPSDAPRPFASNLNPVAGRSVANLVFTRIGADGNIGLYNALGRTGLVVDVVGYWDELRTSEAGRYVPFQRPFRYYDSRDGDGPMAAGFLRSLRVGGFPPTDPVIPTPQDGAMAVTYNLTATNTTAGGYLSAFPGPIGTAPPLASNLNFVAGETVASLAITGYAADGEVSFYNPAGSTDVVIDVAGFFTSASF